MLRITLRRRNVGAYLFECPPDSTYSPDLDLSRYHNTVVYIQEAVIRGPRSRYAGYSATFFDGHVAMVYEDELTPVTALQALDDNTHVLT